MTETTEGVGDDALFITIQDAYLRGLDWGRKYGSTEAEELKASYDYADKTIAAWNRRTPTPSLGTFDEQVSGERLREIAVDADNFYRPEIKAMASELLALRAASRIPNSDIEAAALAFEAAMNKVPSGNPYEDCRRLRIEGTKLLADIRGAS